MKMRFFILILALGLAPTLTACGGDEEQTSSIANRPKSSKKKKKKKKKGATTRTASAAGEVDMTRIPPRFREIDWEVQSEIVLDSEDLRDPFRPYVDDLRVEALEAREQSITELATAIDDAEVGDLKLVALITGIAPHTAMVEDGRGVGHELRVGDIVGRKPPMRVVRITRNELILRTLEKPKDDRVDSEFVLELLTQEQLQEQLR